MWKHSKILLILKPRKPPDFPSSYRPISLLPSFSKILETNLLKRIYPNIKGKKTLFQTSNWLYKQSFCPSSSAPNCG